MGVNKSSARFMIVPQGAVMTEGGSTQLAKGQIGLFNVEEVGKKGAKAVSTTAGADKKHSKFEVRLGVENRVSRTLSNKSSKTLPFNLTDVAKAWVGRPHVTEQKFDEWYLGYDGFDTEKSFAFKKGDNFQIDLILWGKPLGYLNHGKLDQFVAKYATVIPGASIDNCTAEDPCEPIDCREQTLEIANYFNNYALPTGDTLSRYLDINPVLDCKGGTPDDLTEYTLYELDFCGFDKEGELGSVQAQYPEVEVVRDNLSHKFQILTPTTEGAPADYTTTLADLIPGCEGCPAGYSEVEGGFVYVVKLEDEGADESATVEAISTNAVTGTAAKQGQDFGVGYYTVILSSKLTQTEKDDFLTANATSTTLLAGEKDAVCTNATTETFAWEAVNTANATVRQFEIVLGDDCAGTRLAELEEAYEDLVITEEASPAPSNCIRKYTTEVVTDIVFDSGCENSTVIKNVYTAEAPFAFDVNAYWTEVVANGATDCSCGIRIKAKPVVVDAAGECLIDDLPFIATSMRVKAAGGYITNKYLNAPIMNNPFAAIQVERAQDLDNLGGNMRGFEKQGRMYFQNESYHSDVYTRAALGLENQLEGLTQYSTYAFQVDRATQTQGFGGYGMDSIVYHMIVPAGKSNGVEALHTAIAAGAGVPVESL